MQKSRKKIETIFKAKQQRRNELATLPIEEKVKILIKLQEIALPIFLARGLKKTVWRI